jgi:voltage-gated sodium channel
MIATFTVLNLFIAIIVDVMQTMTDHSQSKAKTYSIVSGNTDLSGELTELSREIKDIKKLLEQHNGR